MDDDDEEVQLPPILLPGYEARAEARAIFGLTFLVLGLAAFLYLVAPGGTGLMILDGDGPDPRWVVVPLGGIGMLLFGLAWMVRIYRSAFNGEPDPDHWRYRSR